MKDLIETLDEVVMKQVFDKDEYIIAVNRAKSILEKIDEGKIEKKLNVIDNEVKKIKYGLTNKGRAIAITNWLGGGE